MMGKFRGEIGRKEGRGERRRRLIAITSVMYEIITINNQKRILYNATVCV